MSESDHIGWGVDMEVNLFHAMRGHKPVGVNRNFQLAFIHDKLNNISHKKITATQIWKQLGAMYDLNALNESEILPFPNKETDFSLPEDDFKDLIHKNFPRSPTKIEESKSDQKTEKETHTTKSGKSDKSESKHIENKHTSNVTHANTPENSPKRKRTRNTPSAQPSPANTPDAPPTKRRR